MSNEKKYWIKMEGEEYSVLVKCSEETLSKPGLVRVTRLSKDGVETSLFIKTALIISASEVEEEEEEEKE